MGLGRRISIDLCACYFVLSGCCFDVVSLRVSVGEGGLSGECTSRSLVVDMPSAVAFGEASDFVFEAICRGATPSR